LSADVSLALILADPLAVTPSRNDAQPYQAVGLYNKELPVLEPGAMCYMISSASM